MAYGYLAEIPGVRKEQYDALFEKVTGFSIDDDRILPDFLVHVAARLDNGNWLIVDVLDSKEATERFLAERMGPASAEIGAPPAEPRFFEVSNLRMRKR